MCVSGRVSFRQGDVFVRKNGKLDELEQQFNPPYILANTMMVVSGFFFICDLCIAEMTDYGSESVWEKGMLIAGGVMTVAVIIAVFVISHQIIEMEKKLNPEKQGFVLDTNFEKVWLNSCYIQGFIQVL